MTGIDKTVRAPGDDKHLNRLLDAWARAEDSVAGRPVIAGRLRRLVGVLVIVGALDGLRDADGNERIGFKGVRAMHWPELFVLEHPKLVWIT